MSNLLICEAMSNEGFGQCIFVVQTSGVEILPCQSTRLHVSPLLGTSCMLGFRYLHSGKPHGSLGERRWTFQYCKASIEPTHCVSLCWVFWQVMGRSAKQLGAAGCVIQIPYCSSGIASWVWRRPKSLNDTWTCAPSQNPNGIFVHVATHCSSNTNLHPFRETTPPSTQGHQMSLV